MPPLDTPAGRSCADPIVRARRRGRTLVAARGVAPADPARALFFSAFAGERVAVAESVV